MAFTLHATCKDVCDPCDGEDKNLAFLLKNNVIFRKKRNNEMQISIIVRYYNFSFLRTSIEASKTVPKMFSVNRNLVFRKWLKNKMSPSLGQNESHDSRRRLQKDKN